MKSSALKIISIFWLFGSLTWAGASLMNRALAAEDLGAQNVGDIIDRLEDTAIKSQIIQKDAAQPTIYQYIGRFINLFLAFLGVIFLAIVIYSGFNWMMAKGNQQAVDDAVKHIESASIGIVIIILSYIFINFLVFKIMGIGTGLN